MFLLMCLFNIEHFGAPLVSSLEAAATNILQLDKISVWQQ